MPRVLIVEDEPIIAADLQMTLERLGYEVPIACDSGDEALDRVGEVRPDLVLMDIHIRGQLDGIATAARMRSDHGLPVVFLTAYADDATIRRASDTEPFGYLLKPFNERALRSAIEVALRRRESERRDAAGRGAEVVETLVRRLAHEINNPLAVVVGNAHAALGQIDALAVAADDSSSAAVGELREVLDDILSGAGRLRGVMRSLAPLAGAGPGTRDQVLVGDLVGAAAATIQRESPGVILRLDVPPLPPVLGDATRLGELLVEIVRCAVGDEASARPREAVLRVGGRRDGDSHVLIEIEDSGEGMTPEAARRAFDPWFASPLGSARAGLGLAVCQRAAHAMGGAITLDSWPGRGHVFRVRLPSATV